MSSSCTRGARPRCSPIRAGSAYSLSSRRKNRSFHLAEADAIAVALAPAAHHERVAVFKERALDAGGELHRLGAFPADLQQAAALMLLRTGDRATAQEVADIHGAAAGSMVHALLHRRPVHVFEVGAADALRFIHAVGAQGDVELHVIVVRPRLF